MSASRGVAIREFPLPGHGFADYLLYVDGKAAGVIEAKKQGTSLIGVETQSTKYNAPGLARLGTPAALRLRIHRRRNALHQRIGSNPALAPNLRLPPARNPDPPERDADERLPVARPGDAGPVAKPVDGVPQVYTRGAGAPRSRPSVLRSSSSCGQWMP